MQYKQYLKLITHNEIVRERLKIINFFDGFGPKATREAFGYSRSTVYLWKKKYKDSKSNLESLVPKSKRPKNTRVMVTDERILSFIKNLRENNYRFGKAKIKILLDEYCEEEGVKKVSVSTIGKIIKRYNLYYDGPVRLYHDPRRREAKRRKRPRISARFKSKYSGELVQIDTVVRFDMKRYILAAIDLCSKFSFAFGYKRLSSRLALDFYQKLERVAPFEIKGVKTDNGLEFMGEFDEYLEKKGAKHYFSYPRTPESNAYIERFNRSLQEEFVDRNIEHLEDMEIFNRKLIDYLIFFNTVRPHQALSYSTPMGYLVSKHLLSNMSATYTSI